MSGATRERDLVLALSGGVGGAKLVLGLSKLVPSDRLVVIANTGDDFEHLGLYISPDIDTLLYTLAGLNNPETGWGRRDETWTFMAALEALGGETWFRLGDGDLAIHVERTRRLKAGEPLSQIVRDFSRRLGISARIIPMTDAPVHTRVQTRDGWLAISTVFRRAAMPSGSSRLFIRRRRHGKSAPGFSGRPEKPGSARGRHLSFEPLYQHRSNLGIARRSASLADCAAPVVAVSPVIGGRGGQGTDRPKCCMNSASRSARLRSPVTIRSSWTAMSSTTPMPAWPKPFPFRPWRPRR